MTTENINGIDLAALKAFIEDVRHEPRKGAFRSSVSTRWAGQARSDSTVSSLTLGGKKIPHEFQIRADEPRELLGEDTAPSPQELLLSALNACMIVTYAANATALGIKLDSLKIETEGELDLRGFLGIDSAVKPGYSEVHITVHIKSSASRERLEELHRIAMRVSPNFSSLASPIRMLPNLVLNAS
jgi:uncharacterized OsmC-like protein